MDLVDHGHHGPVAAGRSAEGFQPLSLGTDGIVFHDQTIDAPVFPAGEDVKIVGDRLRPALLGISDGQGCHVPAEGQIRIFQPFPRRLRIIGFVQDPQVRAHRRKLFGVLLQHAHAHAASHHQQIEQIVIGRKTVDHGKGAVIVRHRVLIRHRRSSHPQGTSGQELAQMVNIVIQLLRFLSGRGRQGAVVFHRPPHGLPPEFPAPEPGQEPGIGARIHKRAELLHGTRRMLVGA